MNESVKHTIEMAQFIADQFTAKWLCYQIKITFPTFKKRLTDGKFTVEQAEKIKEIYDFLK